MENKVDLKRCLIQTAVLVAAFVLGGIVLNYLEYQRYIENYNQKLNAVLVEVKENYPEITEAALMEIFESEAGEEKADSWLKSYGIDLQKDSLILENESDHHLFQAAYVILLLLLSLGIIAVFLQYNRKKDRELAKITRYIEEINQKNYKLEIDDMSEDELSILKNEIYKTTVMLKEVAEHSVKAKNDLKDSLSDISHQLKTPLTSISVILDNLMDDPEMPVDVRMDFIHDMKREVRNINFLVQSLLKLSKLDSNTVVFLEEEVKAQKIVEAAMQNVAMLCDLKNVTIKVDGNVTEECVMHCDFRWQVEALTNILKNCVEHSPDNSRILIGLDQNQVYTSISIRDFGKGIDEEDQKHIFERFYKGKNASQDSVGIGLALAKAIVEADRGHISVESGKNGTKFVIKYFHIK